MRFVLPPGGLRLAFCRLWGFGKTFPDRWSDLESEAPPADKLEYSRLPMRGPELCRSHDVAPSRPPADMDHVWSPDLDIVYGKDLRSAAQQSVPTGPRLLCRLVGHSPQQPRLLGVWKLTEKLSSVSDYHIILESCWLILYCPVYAPYFATLNKPAIINSPDISNPINARLQIRCPQNKISPSLTKIASRSSLSTSPKSSMP